MDGTFINKNFTWGGDVHKHKFYLGRGRLYTIILPVEGTFINKNFTCGWDVYKEIFYLWRGGL